MLWKIVEDDFGNEDWKCRFAAGQYNFLPAVTFVVLLITITNSLDPDQVR